MAGDPQPLIFFFFPLIITSVDLLYSVTQTQNTHLHSSDSRAQGIPHPGHQILSLLLCQTFSSWQGKRAHLSVHLLCAMDSELSFHTSIYQFSCGNRSAFSTHLFILIPDHAISRGQAHALLGAVCLCLGTRCMPGVEIKSWQLHIRHSI